MKPAPYTKEHVKWLREKYQHMNARQLTRAYNDHFGQNRSHHAIRTVMHRHGITADRNPIQEITLFTPEQVEFVKEQYRQLGRRDLLATLNSKFGLDIKLNQLVAFIKNHKIHSGRTGRIEKGTTPWNKGKTGYGVANRTSFKSGHKPHNTKHLYRERIGKDGYVEMCVPEINPHTGAKWRYKHKHLVIWEFFNGPLPESHAVIFKDGDKYNFDPDNLVLVHRNELLSLNLHSYRHQPDEIKESVLALARLEAKAGFRLIHSLEKARQNAIAQRGIAG